MAPTPEHHEIAASIDKEVSAFPDTAGGLTLRSHRHEYGHSRWLFRDEVKTTNQHRDDGRIPGTTGEIESLSWVAWG